MHRFYGKQVDTAQPLPANAAEELDRQVAAARLLPAGLVFLNDQSFYAVRS